MVKMKRTDRIAALTRILSGTPNKLFTLSSFCEKFKAAKSTLSEDITIISDSLLSQGLGTVETVAGAAGGVRFRSSLPKDEAFRQISEICAILSDPMRILPGGYLYWSDILTSPTMARTLGNIIAGEYYDVQADFVLTMETKGIPVAMMTAEALNIPLIIARRSSKVYEGSAVNINYASGHGNIETMALARRAVKEGQRALIVDDYIKAGGTAHGMVSLMNEFSVQVVGLAFVLAQQNPPKRYIEGDKALMMMSTSENGDSILVKPAPWLYAGISPERTSL